MSSSIVGYEDKRIAVAQMCSGSDLQKNLETCERLVDQAISFGAKLISFPECFAFMGEKSGDSLAVADSLDGPLFSKYRKLATKGIWISYGGFHEKTRDPQKVFNSHVIVDSQGDIKGVYRKLHLFKVDIKGGPSLNEFNSTTPGTDIVVVDSPVGKLGLSTCYDVRFPELYILLRKLGSDVILVPSAFTLMTGKDHWEVLLRARAIETQCWVAAAAQYGQHNPTRASYGRSCIIDPWGTTVACCPDVHPTSSIANLDHTRTSQVRASMPVFEHRRPEIYGNISLPKLD